jgi:hypothetical protein
MKSVEEIGGLTASMKEIITSKVHGIDFQYAESIPYIGKEQAEARRERDLTNLKTKPMSSGFYIVGCIVYAYRSGSAFGKTAFVLDIFRPCTESPVGECSFEVSRRRDYEANEIQVKEYNRDLLAE